MKSILRRYWPPEGQILLLIAALADLETARQAWREWNARQELADATSSEVRLLAAVARRMPQLAPEAAADPRLVGSRRYIWTQTQMTLGTTRPLLAALQAEGLRLMLMKGAARLSGDPMLAQERALRDIDVLVHPDDWERALRLALREGWKIPGSKEFDPARLRRKHAIGLISPQPNASGEFDLHRHALWECRNEGQDAGLWERAVPVRFLNIDVLRPSVTDLAVVALGQSMLYSGGPQAAHWALDVDPVIRTGKMDWNVLLSETHRRRIELYIAAPLLMLRERIGCPVPPEILRDLTRQVGKYALVEFKTRTTGYGARLPEQFDAVRIAAAARAMRVARDHPRAAAGLTHSSPLPVRHSKLGPDEEIAIPVPTGGAPFARLRLHLAFDVHHARGHAYLKITAPGLGLKLIPIERASKKHGGRTRRDLMLVFPACLFELRDVDQLRVRTNDRLAIRNVVVSWGRPAAAAPLKSLAAVLRPLWRWRDGVRRSSAG